MMTSLKRRRLWKENYLQIKKWGRGRGSFTWVTLEANWVNTFFLQVKLKVKNTNICPQLADKYYLIWSLALWIPRKSYLLSCLNEQASHGNFHFHLLPISQPNIQTWESTPAVNSKKIEIIMISGKHRAYLTMTS